MTGAVLEFLGGHPGRIALFEAVEAAVTALGARAVEVRKTQLSWGNPRRFAFLSYPRGVRKNLPEGAMTLTFGLGRRLEHPRVAQAVEPYPGRWTHHTLLTGPGDVDGEVGAFLREAYRFAETKKRGG